jgi:hypothetical protein
MLKRVQHDGSFWRGVTIKPSINCAVITEEECNPSTLSRLRHLTNGAHVLCAEHSITKGQRA